jgi:hypothetical protein
MWCAACISNKCLSVSINGQHENDFFPLENLLPKRIALLYSLVPALQFSYTGVNFIRAAGDLQDRKEVY